MATILFVEDNQGFRKPWTRILQKAGHKVIIAVDADEANRALTNHGPEIDLVLADLHVPDNHDDDSKLPRRALASGGALVDYRAAMNDHGWTAPIWVVTGELADEELMAVLKEHADRFLVKGAFTPDFLVEEIEELLTSPRPRDVPDYWNEPGVYCVGGCRVNMAVGRVLRPDNTEMKIRGGQISALLQMFLEYRHTAWLVALDPDEGIKLQEGQVDVAPRLWDSKRKRYSEGLAKLVSDIRGLFIYGSEERKKGKCAIDIQQREGKGAYILLSPVSRVGQG